MAIFARRRIQKMLDDLSKNLTSEKRKDLVNRLNDKRDEQSLPAEIELALTWMLRSLDLEIEPEWWLDGKQPDIYVEGLIHDVPAVIEVKAISDNSMSGEPQMVHCSQEIMKIADSISRGFGEFLYFYFHERSDINRNRSERSILAPINYQPSNSAISTIKNWVLSCPKNGSRIRIEDNGLLVDVEKKETRTKKYLNYHVSRPPRVYSDTRNLIYKELSKKASQIENAPDNTWRIIFLADAGSRFLADINSKQIGADLESYSKPEAIINKFIKDKSDKVDAVVVFVPIKQLKLFGNPLNRYDTKWKVVIFGYNNSNNNALMISLNKLIIQLPEPRFTGYNARSLIRQNAMRHDSRGWYVGTKVNWSSSETTFRISLRAFQDFLARRISEEEFRHHIGDKEQGPSISRCLDQGLTISNIEYESCGLDEDDDYVILKFSRDAAASPFK